MAEAVSATENYTAVIRRAAKITDQKVETSRNNLSYYFHNLIYCYFNVKKFSYCINFSDTL